MKRAAYSDLSLWLKSTNRKPLIIRGARQVGKTWLARNLAKENKHDLIELNFERDPLAVELFESNDPRESLKRIERRFGRRIQADKTLLLLDEIQAAPQILAKLRWFYEELPQLPVIAAGSLLDFALEDHSFSMPVGRIRYLYLEPLSFEEFLDADGKSLLIDYLESVDLQTAIDPSTHRQLLDSYRTYMLIGGMPEAVAMWKDTQSLVACSEVHQSLLDTFRDDFAKYAGRIPTLRLARVFDSIPRLLGRKFKYASVSGNDKAAAIKHSLDLLCKARLCHRVHATHARGVPLQAEIQERIFKAIFCDTGLVSTALGLWRGTQVDIREACFVNEGSLAEQSIGQALRTIEPRHQDPALQYWAREKRGSEAELDYLIQHGAQIIPIEVKAGATGSLKSLHLFMSERKLPIALRLNTDQPSTTQVNVKTPTGKSASYQLISLPLYLTGQIHRLLKTNE